MNKISMKIIRGDMKQTKMGLLIKREETVTWIACKSHIMTTKKRISVKSTKQDLKYFTIIKIYTWLSVVLTHPSSTDNTNYHAVALLEK